MRDSGGGVCMGRKVVEFRDSVVRALWHRYPYRWMLLSRRDSSTPRRSLQDSRRDSLRSPATRQNYLQCALFSRVPKGLVGLHDVVHCEPMCDQLAGLQLTGAYDL